MDDEQATPDAGPQEGLASLWRASGRTDALLEAMQEGVVLHDASTAILAANSAAERILGLTLDQMQGRTSMDPTWRSVRADGTAWPGEDHPSMRCLRTGEPQRNQIMGVASSGRMRWLSINVSPIYDDPAAVDGAPDGVVATFADITEHIEASRDLADSEQRFRLIAERSRDLIIRTDEDGRITYASDAATRFTGLAPDALLGCRLSDLIHAEDAAELVDDGRSLHDDLLTFRIRHQGGFTRWVEASNMVITGDATQVGGVLSILRDVSDRVIAEEAVREAEERFRLAFDMAPTGNAIVDPKGRFMRSNERLQTMLGVAKADLLGHSVSEFVRPEDSEQLASFLQRVVGQHEQSHTCEVRLVHSGGRPVHASLTASVVHDADGEGGYLIVQVEDITARKLAQAALTHQATHDALTALPNRTLLLDRLGHALARASRTRREVALLFCDVDRFKRINDSLGHEAGDMLLVEIGRRLRAIIRASDTAGRLGGDEFLIICEELDRGEDALALADRVRAAIEEPIQVSGYSLTVSLSIGVAFASTDDEPASLLRRADTAMYEAKERGRGRFEVFDEALRLRARQRLELEGELRAGVADGQLRLHHQPVVDLQDGSIVGREALVRWQHPTRGLLYPGAFLEVAEETDLIIDLGGWVLLEACREGASLGGEHVAVNVSARQLGRPDFRGQVERALELTGLAHEKLVLELTETSLLHASQNTLADVDALTRRGVRLAVDDFGTGYSSLTYLQRLPVGIVKIDRSFVAEMTTDRQRTAITKAVVDLGRALDLEVIAEGVETVAQAALLADLGCTHAQGYLFGRPEPLLARAPQRQHPDEGLLASSASARP